MKKICFNRDWMFAFQNDIDEFNTFGFGKYSDAAGAAARFYNYSNWKKVDLPHDWAVSLQKSSLANTFAGAYPNTPYHRFMLERHSELEGICSIGWYRKQFAFAPEWEGKRVFIEFEGIFRDAIVWVNGVYLDRHTSGYTSFALELTDHLVAGEENSIAVRVDSEQAEGWWYEGAGIYRNVHLLIGEPVYFKYNQTVIRTETDGRVFASAVLVNDAPDAVQQAVLWDICAADGSLAAQAQCDAAIAPYTEQRVEIEMVVAAPQLWSVDTPYLYSLTLRAGAEQTTERFGFRSVHFDPDSGFFLNGKPLKIHGACVHQDFGGVGVALTDNLQYYKIKRLKEMGVNAYRCAHNAPSPVLLDACDELGMLVMDETRMFGTSPEAVRQLTALLERDRNHPCVFIWSLGNEEFCVHDDVWSYKLMEKATRLAKALDPTRPVCYGGCNGPNFVGANGAAEVRGVNYIRNDSGTGGDWLDKYHRAHPAQPIIGTEESSYVVSRGGAVNDMGSLQLDSTGSVTMPWGSTPKGWVKFAEARDYFAGGFMWTGFDYRGEPNPFYYANTVSSFGTIDLCGMEKPPFYYYKAWWTEESVLKLAPHWNHKAGDTVTVAVFTNCEEITLSLNGKVLETRRVERFDAPLFEVEYAPGVLCVEGVRNGTRLRDTLVTAGETAQVRCIPVLEIERADDTAIYELNAYDANGVFCLTAADEIEVCVAHGCIVGVGNGDPSSMDYEQKPQEVCEKYIQAFNEGDTVFWVPMKRANTLRKRTDAFVFEQKDALYEDDFRILAEPRAHAPQEHTTELVTTVRDAERFSYVEFERLGGKARVYLNGELIGDTIKTHGTEASNLNRPYRFYCKFGKGENELKVTFLHNTRDDLPLISGYVKLGRVVDSPWRVRLHYGKARVFVQSKTPAQLTLTASIK